jgi:hypothetical protein
MPYMKGKVKPYKNTTKKPAEKKKSMAKKKPMKK